MNQRIARVTCFGPAPRTGGGAGLTSHQPPVMHKAEEKTRRHQPHRNLGVDARAASVGTIKLAHLSAKPPKVENPIDFHQHMIIRDQPPQRPGNEKFQLPAPFATQHRSPPSNDKQSESEAEGFFNSPHWINSKTPFTLHRRAAP